MAPAAAGTSRLALLLCAATALATTGHPESSPGAPPAPPPPTPPSLKSLAAGGAGGLALTPAFKPTVTGYTVLEQPATQQLTATAFPSVPGSALTVSGSGWLVNGLPLPAGAPSPPVNLTAPTSYVQVHVWSADKKASTTYQISAAFAPSPPASVGLRSVTVSGGGKPLALVPPFNSTAPPTAIYSAKVPDGVDWIQVAVVTLNSTSRVVVSGSGAPPSSPILSSGSVLQKLVSSPQQAATVTVTGGDRKTVKTFTVRLNSTVCAVSPIANGLPCNDTYCVQMI